ncbi:NADH:ubiquinone oxidoreductase [Irineochytrium annulatum]|nr:NADH:ubiquinone oxidoreductase [Irineochytrium annulatum]
MSAACPNCDALRKELEEAQKEFDEFQSDSREYEAELDKEVTDLKKRNQAISRELEELRTKLSGHQAESNRTINQLQQEVEVLRKVEREYRHQTRELEIMNSELEQSFRVQTSSAEDLEGKYNKVLERTIFLEHELDSKIRVEEESQRLRDELRDVQTELSVLRSKSSLHLSDTPTTSAAHTPLPTTPPPPISSSASDETESEATLMSDPRTPDPQPRGVVDDDLTPHATKGDPLAADDENSPLDRLATTDDEPTVEVASAPPRGPPVTVRTKLPVLSNKRMPSGAISTLAELLARAKSLELRITAARDNFVQPMLNGASGPGSPVMSPVLRAGRLPTTAGSRLDDY